MFGVDRGCMPLPTCPQQYGTPRHLLTNSRETRFSFSYEIPALVRPNVASDEINRARKFDDSLSFGAKQSALQVGQISFEL